MTLTRVLTSLALALSLVAFCAPNFAAETAANMTNADATKVIGTWTGESICVGYRPACKNEVVVYRFVAVPGKSDVVTLYADKILDGKRVPMGKLDFVYDEKKNELSGEFTRRQTHGLWQFKVTGDVIEGTLVLLPDKSVGRQVKVHRTTEDKVPEAPSLTEYEARLGSSTQPLQRIISSTAATDTDN